MNFKTKKEMERSARNARIKQEFAEMRKAHPELTAHRLHVALGEKYGVCYTTIINALAR